jgi:branched-chain amino acid transport system ATP-binding protein
MNAPVLSLHGATKRFGGLVAVDDMTFDVAEHQVMGLIGPNGSGKSTTLNLISGALKPTSGTISLRGTRISDLPPQAIGQRGVARTFQLVRLLPSMTVLENVMAGAIFGHRRRWGAEAEEHAMHVLDTVGIAHRAGARPSQLTYIDTKRVELARVLAGDPKILLLDEWLAGLNPSELKLGIDLVRDLRNEGRTIIMVEHVMDAIRSLCDRVVVMSSGLKIADGGVASVLSDPDVVRAYLGDDDA